MSVNDPSRIVIDSNSWVKLQIVASLTDNSRGVIYNINMFVVQATEVYVVQNNFWSSVANRLDHFLRPAM
jgi:hypothetical protein